MTVGEAVRGRAGLTGDSEGTREGRTWGGGEKGDPRCSRPEEQRAPTIFLKIKKMTAGPQ